MKPLALPRPLPNRKAAARGAGALVLLAGLGLTWLVAWQAGQSMRSAAEVQFRATAHRLAEEIVDRVRQPVVGLRGARAMIAAHGDVDRLMFRRFVAARDMQRDFPGIRGFGFVERVPREDLEAFIARERADHAPDFAVRSTSQADDLLVIKYIEPQNSIWGMDIGGDPVRREAAERAIATGQASLTEPVVLVRGGIYGWLLFLPVYRPNAEALPPRERLLGLLYAPIGVPEVLGPLADFAGGQVAFQLIERLGGKSTVVFDSRPPAAPGSPPPVARVQAQPMFEEMRTVAIGGRTFWVKTTSTPKMEAGLTQLTAIAVGVAGSALSLLLALAIMRLMLRRQQAEDQTQEVAADLERVAGGLAERDRLIGLIKDSIPARLSYWDREMRCRLANKALAREFGRTPEEMIGLRLDEMLPPERRADSVMRGQAALRGEAQQFESSAVPGKIAAVYYVPDQVGPEVQGFFVFAHDITELKKAQHAAQQASAAKTEFLSNISHEIRTPMNAVLGMLALLRLTRLDARQDDYAVKAEAAARSLLSLLNDVLDFSKIEAGKMALDPRPFSFRALIDDLAVILAASVGEKPIELDFDLDPAVPPWLLGDDMRLRQILINLGGNAIKFTRRGKVGVQVRLLARDAAHAEVQLAVSDTGIGISAADQQRIFADFSQAAASTTREFGGTGLGLSICQRLAALMGTQLQVDSVAGQGSRFHFRLRLPLAEAPQQSDSGPSPLAASPLPPGRPLRGCRLLVVEDNLINQQVARELLEAAGAEVHLAGNGREAVLAVAGRGPFDAVLMDVQMPVLDGYQATREIRGRLRQVDLPIIAMTANAMDSDREQALAAGMNDHVGKPFSPAGLVATVLRHVTSVEQAPAPASPPAAAEADFDRAAALAGLGGDEELLQRLLPLFRRDVLAARAQLPGLRAGSLPAEEATRLLHTLKSTAATLGAFALARAAAAAEQASLDTGPALDGSLVEALEGAIELTLAELPQA